MKVKNLSGTSKNKCKCGSWIKHWRKYSNQEATVCRVIGCSRKDLVGAHVQKTANYDGKWYIVPFCKGHNGTSGSFEIIKGTKLVSANVSSTCG